MVIGCLTRMLHCRDSTLVQDIRARSAAINREAARKIGEKYAKYNLIAVEGVPAQ